MHLSAHYFSSYLTPEGKCVNVFQWKWSRSVPLEEIITCGIQYICTFSQNAYLSDTEYSCHVQCLKEHWPTLLPTFVTTGWGLSNFTVFAVLQLVRRDSTVDQRKCVIISSYIASVFPFSCGSSESTLDANGHCHQSFHQQKKVGYSNYLAVLETGLQPGPRTAFLGYFSFFLLKS